MWCQQEKQEGTNNYYLYLAESGRTEQVWWLWPIGKHLNMDNGKLGAREH